MTILQNIFRRFDSLEQRMALIRKYANYGSGSKNIENIAYNCSSDQIERVILNQKECANYLKLLGLTLIGKGNKRVSSFKYQMVTNYAYKLLDFLRDLEKTRSDIVSERQINAKHHTLTKTCLLKVTSCLEGAFESLKHAFHTRHLNSVTSSIIKNLEGNISTSYIIPPFLMNN